MTTHRSWNTEVLLSITTGRLLCEFSDVHRCVEFLNGGPVWTHQMAHKPFVDELKQAVLAQYPDLAAVDPESIDTANWQTRRDELIREYGATRELAPARSITHYQDAMTKPLEGKEVIVVNSPSGG